MTVSALRTFALREYNERSRRGLGVSGWFGASQTVTGDGSGGRARITLAEPDDSQLQYRALKIVSIRVSKTLGAVDTGDLFVTSKTDSNSDIYMPLQGRTVRAGVTVVQYSGLIDDIGSVLRARDWFMPSYGAVTPSELEIVVEFDNDAGAPVWTATVFGYYLMLE